MKLFCSECNRGLEAGLHIWDTGVVYHLNPDYEEHGDVNPHNNMWLTAADYNERLERYFLEDFRPDLPLYCGTEGHLTPIPREHYAFDLDDKNLWVTDEYRMEHIL